MSGHGLVAARRRRQSALRWTVVAVLAVFFLLPLVSMFEFSTRAAGGGRTFALWRSLVNLEVLQERYPELWSGLLASLGLTVLTVSLMLVLLVPTMTWVRLRLPRWSRVVEFLCLLPLTIPAIVVVVGLAPVYAWVVYFLGESPHTLVFAYTVLVLPYAYRALDSGLTAIDVRTLSEAARSLGAGWPTVMWWIIVPNLRSALLSASFISVALVLGEFTIASLLNQDNLQVAINLLGKRDAQAAVAVSLAALLFAFALLFLLSLVGRRRRARPTRPVEPGEPASLKETAA